MTEEEKYKAHTMTVSQAAPPHTDDDSVYHYNKQQFAEHLRKLSKPTIKKFNKILFSHLIFHTLFLGAITIELFSIVAILLSSFQSSLFAISLALFFLTIFSYFILRLYVNSRKPERFLELLDDYINHCKTHLNYQHNIPEHHLALAHAANKLGSHLHNTQYSYYKPPQWLDMIAHTIETFSCWCHWHDIHQMRQLLYSFAIDEHIKVIRIEPTNLEAHAALANSYVLLSGLYINQRKTNEFDDDRWTPSQQYSEEMHDKFQGISQRAIEEFRILNDYAPHDPWVHAQLAYSYHDMQMPQQEIQEYETIIQLLPGDAETLFKLGMLYFQQGMNAKGLQTYDTLRQIDYNRAQQLINFYGF